MLPGISGESLLKQVAGNTVYLSYYKFLNIQSKPHNLPTSQMNSYELPLMLTWLTVLKQDGINNSWHISLNPHSPSKDLESQSPRSPAGRGAWKVCMPDPSHWVSLQRFGNSMLTPDSYSGQLGVILAIDSSDKGCLLSGLYILGAMSFRPPLSDCHLTLANIIIINISSFKPQQYAALAELSPCVVQAGLPGGYIPRAYKGAWCFSWGPLPSAAAAGGLHHNG